MIVALHDGGIKSKHCCRREKLGGTQASAGGRRNARVSGSEGDLEETKWPHGGHGGLFIPDDVKLALLRPYIWKVRWLLRCADFFRVRGLVFGT
jgi:hypothetical protein